MKLIPLKSLLPAVLMSVASLTTQAADAVSGLRLYAMDCGQLTIKDAAMFSDTGDYDGKSLKAVVSCYLIQHPKGTLLWDAGLNDQIAQTPGGVDAGGGNFHLQVSKPLLPQLAKVGVTPENLSFIAFSHLHFDHTGNANAFGKSTWLMNKAELAAAMGDPPSTAMDPMQISAHKTAKVELLSGDHDVFGDGRVRIVAAPGHTPGHQVLMLDLAKAGPVILSGDLYHTHENRKERNVPIFNTNRADTLASFDRVEKLIKNRKARFVVQHVQADLDALPKFPAYLD